MEAHEAPYLLRSFCWCVTRPLLSRTLSTGCKMVTHLQHCPASAVCVKHGMHRQAATYHLYRQAGYAVIFLNRKHSIQPFTKGLPSGEILECLPVLDSSNESSDGQDGSHIVQQAIARATEARQQGTLLRLSFETVFEYLSVRAPPTCCSAPAGSVFNVWYVSTSSVVQGLSSPRSLLCSYRLQHAA